MFKMSRNLGLLLLIIIIGAILGGVFGEIIGVLTPKEGKISQFFLKGPILTLNPSTWNLIVLTITFGFNLKINICSVLGILMAVFIFRRL